MLGITLKKSEVFIGSDAQQLYSLLLNLSYKHQIREQDQIAWDKRRSRIIEALKTILRFHQSNLCLFPFQSFVMHPKDPRCDL